MTNIIFPHVFNFFGISLVIVVKQTWIKRFGFPCGQHSFLWFSTDNERLSATAKNLIEDPGNEIFLSIVVGWEIAIKASLGKLSLAQPVDVILNRALQSSRWKLLGIEVRHLGILSTLPFYHRDPFDRLLVAQSMVDDLPFVSNDVKLDDYGVGRQW